MGYFRFDRLYFGLAEVDGEACMVETVLLVIEGDGGDGLAAVGIAGTHVTSSLWGVE